MIRIFNRNRNAIGQFMVALIFLGTFGFLFTSDGFVSESQAANCCCSGEVTLTSFAADSSGDYGSDIPMDASVQSDIMNKVIPSSSNNDGGNGDDCACISGGCGACGANKCMGSETVGCDDRCDDKDTCGSEADPPCCEEKGDEYCPKDIYSGGDCCSADC